MELLIALFDEVHISSVFGMPHEMSACMRGLSTRSL